MTGVKATVWWEDAQGSATTIISKSSIEEKHKPIVMETMGWIVRDDEKGISICNERYTEDGEVQFRGHTFVPRSLIVKVSKARSSRRSVERTVEGAPA